MSAYRLSAPYERSPLRRRLSGLGLALAINLLLLFVLLGIGVIKPVPFKPTSAIVVDMLPASHDAAPAPRKAAPVKPVTETKPVPVHVPQPPRVKPVRPDLVPQRPLDWVEMTPQEYAAADVGKLPKSQGARSGSGSSGDSAEVGRGPHGEVLYAAEWARHPTDAELGGYLPHNAPEGFGLIACKTVPGNRVDDCIELDQSPRGSHLASAVRQAAWQFRVLPPRKNGVSMVGTWVQIRIDYYQGTRNE